MTNKEYREAHELTSSEKAQIWHEISQPFDTERRHTPRWLPWTGGLAAAACALTVAILTGQFDPGQGPAPDHLDVAVHPSVVPEAAPLAQAPQMAEEKPEGTLGEAEVAQPRALARSAEPEATAKAIAPDAADEAPATQRRVLAAGDRHEPAAEVTEQAFIRASDVAATRDASSRRAEVAVPTTGVVEGRVVDAETGDPLANAVVYIVGSQRVAYSDRDGRFVFRNLPAGRHTLEVKYLGFTDVSQTLVLAEADTVLGDYTMTAEIVETMHAFDVEAAKYMVMVKNVTTEREHAGQKFERFALDSVEDALSREEGIISRSGKLYVRGGRSGEVRTSVDGVSVQRPGDQPAAAPESGGTDNPNDRPYDLVYHQHYGVNPFVDTEDDRLSTFAIEVDDASWTVARRYLSDGHLPPPEAIRLEEMVNYLDAGLDHRQSEDFALHVDGLPSEFGEGLHLVRVGVTARSIADLERRPAHLVFVVDVSGSMARENRLGLVKRSLRVLTEQLQEGDRVGIVVYGSQASVLIEPTGAEDRERILSAIDGLHTNGSTNAEAGLRLAYEMARREQRPGTISRLILCSDGVANVGRTGADSILDAVRRQADEGITLTTVGFGMGNYNDVAMEQLANQGDGTYHYVHLFEDAQRVFRENLTGTLEAMGREVKTQVEFDPAFVERWRLLGYENRDVADEDFRNDSVDAGDIGAGHTAVALYEIKLTDKARRDTEAGWSLPLGTARLRWARPAHHSEAGQVTEIQRGIMTGDLSPSYQRAPAPLRLAVVAAEFAEILRHSYWARGSEVADLIPLAQALVHDLETDDADELLQMLLRTSSLESRDD